VLLSICIPTHHGRAPVLRRALDSVFDQLGGESSEDVEVCVSDNASEDGTEQLVESYRAHEATLRYRRNPTNLGLVPNLLGVVDLAQGTFCWLLGSDDTIEPGGIAKVLAILREHVEVAGVTLNRLRVAHDDSGWSQEDPLDELPDDPGTVHLYTDAPAIFANVGLSQDYMSTQIVNQEVWRTALETLDESELRAAEDLAHLLVLGRMIQLRPRWIWYPERLVLHRTGTSALDEQLGHDFTAFQLVIMRGRSRVWSILFGRNRPLFRTVMGKAYLRSARPRNLAGLKIWPRHGLAEDGRLLVGMTRHFWWLPRFWLVSFPVLLCPHWVVKLVDRVRRAR